MVDLSPDKENLFRNTS
jgi:hypothetical protein